MEKDLRILLVEDVPHDAELEVRELKRAGLRVAHRLVETEDAFREALREFRPNLIISDFSMPHFDGMFALALAHELAPDVPFIFVSGTIGEEYAIRALKNGATDYVLKNNLVRLPASVERALQEVDERAARREAEEALRESQEKYRLLWETTSDAVVLMDEDTRIQYANPAMTSVFGYAPEEVIGRDIALLQPERLREAHRRGVKRYLETGVKTLNWRSVEVVALHHDGHEFPVEVSFSHMDSVGKPLFAGFMRDITERKNQELKIARLSRIQGVLSGINSAIVRIRDRQQLFDEACRIAVEHGGFGVAWIGRYDAKAKEVTPVASAGLEGDYHLMNVKLQLAPDSPTGSGIIARAIQGGRPVYSNDITLEPEVGGERRREAIRRGYRSIIALPLLVEGAAAGTLSLFAKEPGFFDDEELKLLNELAGDISFALEHMAGQERIEKLSRIRSVSSEINAAIVRIRERDELLRDTCHIVSQQGGFELVWIGAIDQDRKEVRPIAWTGFPEEVARAVNWASISSAKGTLGEAMQTRKLSVRNDIEAELPTGKLRQEAVRRGCFSTVCMPVETEGRVSALIVLFAAGRGFFDQDELALLAGVAANVSFALESIVRQEKLERLSRIRNVLGEMNAAIVRIRNKQQLFEEACRIAVEHGNFAMSWIGMVDATAQAIKPVAKAGRDEGYLERLKLTLDPKVTRHLAPAVEALGRNAPVICNDIANDGRMRAWREASLERGYRSTVMLPLVVEQRAAGVFALYAPEPGLFDEEEMKLLVEIAGNVSFALESVTRRVKIERLSRIRTVLGEINAAIVRVRGKQELFAEACRILAEAGAFPFAWIGIVDREAEQLTPVAWTGQEGGYVETMRRQRSLKGTLSPQGGPAVRAVLEKKALFVNDIQNDARVLRKQEHLERKVNSLAALPLLVEDEAVGVLALYAREVGFFDDEELRLLNELAGDIAFALQTIEKQEKLDYLSYYDPLTGLPNRTLFHDRVNQALQSEREAGHKAALLFLDLQRFGIINDTYGRQTGDALLRQIAERLAAVLGGRDYLARLGADTFAAVLHDVKHEAGVAHMLEQGILSAIARPYEIGGEQLRLAAQAGIALFPGDGDDVDTLFRNADAALSKAKQSGDLYLFYAPRMNARVAEQLKLENDLRNALGQEQYVLHYQPRFDLASGQVIGMEALIRWMHPERGLVPPGEFIPLLEETGMILDVGRWALRRAALQHAAWSAKGRLPPRIAVNVSPAQLRRRDFVDYVKDALAPVERAVERVDLEITESMLMEDIQGGIEKLKAIQLWGLHVALDDFGTGYSSLSYLARLPINSLKIDRSFIMLMSKGPEQMAIVSTVISLARALNLKVVAEGVETEEQANLLRLLRCDEAQGYLFSRPVPPEQIEALLKSA